MIMQMNLDSLVTMRNSPLIDDSVLQEIYVIIGHPWYTVTDADNIIVSMLSSIISRSV